MDRQGTDAGDQLARKTGPDDAFPDWALNLEPRHPDVVAAQNRLVDAHMAWTDQQLAKGVPFHPEEHPEGSDYNQHVADLEADGEDLDDLAVASAIALNQRPPD
jgi:hypothetical protein